MSQYICMGSVYFLGWHIALPQGKPSIPDMPFNVATSAPDNTIRFFVRVKDITLTAEKNKGKKVIMQLTQGRISETRTDPAVEGNQLMADEWPIIAAGMAE